MSFSKDELVFKFCSFFLFIYFLLFFSFVLDDEGRKKLSDEHLQALEAASPKKSEVPAVEKTQD